MPGPLSGLTNLIQRPWRRVSDTDLEATRAPAGEEQREAFQAVSPLAGGLLGSCAGRRSSYPTVDE